MSQEPCHDGCRPLLCKAEAFVGGGLFLLTLAMGAVDAQSPYSCPTANEIVASCPGLQAQAECRQCIDSLAAFTTTTNPAFGFMPRSAQVAFAAAIHSPECQALGPDHLLAVMDGCQGCLTTGCEVGIMNCHFEEPGCVACFATDSSSGSCDTPRLAFIQRSCYCPAAFTIDARFVYATGAFGVLSVLGSLCVLAVVYGYNKDRRSHRDRILVGMFLGNLVFSIGNTIPYNLVGAEDNSQCGVPALSVTAQCAGQGLWMGGKFTMALFEVFIVAASIASLRTGSIAMPWRYELPAHVACVAVGVGVFIYFDARCVEYRDDMVAANAASWATVRDYNRNIVAFNGAYNRYSTLVMDLLRGWLWFLGVVLAAWIGQRVYLHTLSLEWSAASESNEEDMARDLWNVSDPYVQGQRANKRLLLAKRKEGYIEVARPLEPYIAVFVAFSIPAIVMATDFCTTINDKDAATMVSCDVICEMVLSLRTMATVMVYFANPQCRGELLDHATLRRKVWLRLRGFGQWCCGTAAGDDDAAGYRVHFNQALEETTEYDRDAPPGDVADGGGTGAGIPYGLMDEEA